MLKFDFFVSIAAKSNLIPEAVSLLAFSMRFEVIFKIRRPQDLVNVQIKNLSTFYQLHVFIKLDSDCSFVCI